MKLGAANGYQPKENNGVSITLGEGPNSSSPKRSENFVSELADDLEGQAADAPELLDDNDPVTSQVEDIIEESKPEDEAIEQLRDMAEDVVEQAEAQGQEEVTIDVLLRSKSDEKLAQMATIRYSKDKETLFNSILNMLVVYSGKLKKPIADLEAFPLLYRFSAGLQIKTGSKKREMK